MVLSVPDSYPDSVQLCVPKKNLHRESLRRHRETQSDTEKSIACQEPFEGSFIFTARRTMEITAIEPPNPNATVPP